jgi:alkaline phosphatase D
MKVTLLVLVFFLTGCASPGKMVAEKKDDKLSIVQGVTNSKEVEFSVVSYKKKDLSFELKDEAGVAIAPTEVKMIERSNSDYVIHKMIFLRDPSKLYNLYAYQGGSLIDQRLVGQGQKQRSSLRLAVVSCMDDFFPQHFKIWSVLNQQNPEYMLMIGDNVYADRGGMNSILAVSPEVLWKRYTDVRMTLPIFFEKKLIPIHAVWDDHDYGENNSGETYKYKNESKEIFETFFAQSLSEDDWEPATGTGGLLTLGDFNLYFLDARFHRSNDADGTHLGDEQTDWLMKKLAEENTPSFIVKGDQFFGGYHRFDSFEGKHPKAFRDFTDKLGKLETPFVFLSGDRHMSEIMQFPRSIFNRPSFEITSSPVHGKVYPETQDSNPWRVVANHKFVNFTIIQNTARDNHWFLDIENLGENGEVYYRREVAVFIKDLQNNLNEVRKKRTYRRARKSYRRSRGRRRR